MIKLLSVNYNTPDLIYNMVKSVRQFYDNEILIIDGSEQKLYEQAKDLLKEFEGIEIHHFSFNLHHGKSIGYGIHNIHSDKILVIDSDVIILKNGILELLEDQLKPESYGIGDVQRVDDNGFNIGSRGGAIGLKESEITGIGYAYLHPAFMLINREVALQWPMPINHGAPMIDTMKAITNASRENILEHCEEIHSDFRNENKVYIHHEWMGTVNRTGGYHPERFDK